MMNKLLNFLKSYWPLFTFLLVALAFFFGTNGTHYGGPIFDSQLLTHMVMSVMISFMCHFIIGFFCLLDAL